ncbi:SDR family oxidoreductase [Sinimarinibacterium sp. CAU 1509]|uniref:SDR family NAD(P)-dependent oxidoreductase n=1 Tax=Sinimarinibacterium sp. CAU 1509 TaxID=2562283 RepID=UPI0010AC55E6|nr:SDR family oxidoreductase [Sinimarinibacterium sp. CAU 1509]TJY58399.1 SDR family oxidoreductase [Sinimarinibacterium sp. CAU 1509]
MFKGKVAVITGAGSGIGRALAQQLATLGANLALSDINRASLDETLASLPASSAKTRTYYLDVSDREAIFQHAEQVVADFGEVHFVFNNAGATIVGTIEHLSVAEIDWQLGVNLWGVICGTKAFLPYMLKQRQGCIINISSVFGIVGFPTQGAYNISKFGVRGLTECLWSELEGTGVRAVCVHPGGIRTAIGQAALRCAAADETEAEFDKFAANLLRTSPQHCAADILKGVRKGKKRIITGYRASEIFWMSRLIPNGYPWLLKKLAR